MKLRYRIIGPPLALFILLLGSVVALASWCISAALLIIKGYGGSIDLLNEYTSGVLNQQARVCAKIAAGDIDGAARLAEKYNQD